MILALDSAKTVTGKADQAAASERPMPALQVVNGTSVNRHSGASDALVVPRKGLQLPQRLTFDKWFEIGRHLSSVATSSAWCLGDWLVYGESAYEGRYRKAVEETMLDYQTLRNYAWVVRRFPLSRRRDTLSFGHHAEVAAMPETEQDYWLRKAEELSWSRNMLRRQVRASLRERGDAGESGEDGDAREPAEEEAADQADGTGAKAIERLALTLEVSISRKQLDICSAAASISGTSLENWVLRTLEEAAREALGQEPLQ
jgi:hypothetical protein